jgi:hypothetical protein
LEHPIKLGRRAKKIPTQLSQSSQVRYTVL